MHASSRRATRGFTLIELLVVIAIIAILAAILFPVFAQAREKARQASCASNEKQLALAVLQYVEDYDEAYPFEYFGQVNNANGLGYDWQVAVQPYIKNGGAAAWAGIYSGGVWNCPSFPSDSGLEEYAQYSNFEDVIPCPSQPTGACGATNGTSGMTQSSVGITLPQINMPSSKIMLFERKNSGANCGGWPASVGVDVLQSMWSSAGQNPPGAKTDIADEHPYDNNGTCWWMGGLGAPWIYEWAYRHNNVQNLLFCDGHVKAMPIGQISFVNNVYNYPSPYESSPGYGPVQ